MAIKSSDQISIVDITDAYSVILSNESHSFVGGTDTALVGSTTTNIYAFQGDAQVPVTIGNITTPTGITASISNNGSTNALITFTVTTSLKTGGTIDIPVTITGTDVTITKKFTYSIAFKGATGATGATGEKGDKGDTGEKGDKGDTGATGAAGADAITISITTDNGNIFKNSSGSTTMTAHVYKAGKELSSAEIAKLGTLKWYQDGGSTAVATGASHTVAASAITNKAVFTVQLEG